MNRNILYLLLAVITGFSPVIVYSGGTSRKLPPGVHAGRGDISGRLRRLEEDMEDLDKKLTHADPSSKKGISLRQRREKLALEMVHEAQNFLLDREGKRDDGRTRKLRLLLQNESNMLKKSIKKAKDFPGADELTDVKKLLLNARKGKYSLDRIPRSNSSLLRMIQKMQKDALEEYHKEEMRNRPR